MKNRRESGIAAENDKNSDTGKLGQGGREKTSRVCTSNKSLRML